MHHYSQFRNPGQVNNMEEDERSPTEFYYPDETTDENATVRYGVVEAAIDPAKQNSQEEIDRFLKEQRAENTVKKTRSDLNIFLTYLESINEGGVEIKELPFPALDRLLCKFFMGVKKRDGTNYEPITISSFQRSIQRHLDKNQYSGNILKDKEFEKSQRFLLLDENL